MNSTECSRTSKPLPEAVSVRQVAEVLGVKYLTVHRWIKMGYIRAYRVGPRLIRIPRSEIARLRQFRIEHQGVRPEYPKV